MAGLREECEVLVIADKEEEVVSGCGAVVAAQALSRRVIYGKMDLLGEKNVESRDFDSWVEEICTKHHRAVEFKKRRKGRGRNK